MYVHLCDLCTSLRKVVLPLPLAPTHTVSVMLLLLFHCTVNVDGVVAMKCSSLVGVMVCGV